MWRGGGRSVSTVAAPFVWRCRNRRTMTPFPNPALRTGRALFRHPALGQDIIPSPTEACPSTQAAGRAPDSRKDTHRGIGWVRRRGPYVYGTTTGAADAW